MSITRRQKRAYKKATGDLKRKRSQSVSNWIEEVRNNIPGQPYMKFGGGWFALISKELMKAIPFPENYGHYGLDDTYLMWGAELLKDDSIKQFKIKNVVVCENYFDRMTTYKGQIQFIDKREEFKKYNEQMFHIGLENLLKNK